MAPRESIRQKKLYDHPNSTGHYIGIMHNCILLVYKQFRITFHIANFRIANSFPSQYLNNLDTNASHPVACTMGKFDRNRRGSKYRRIITC